MSSSSSVTAWIGQVNSGDRDAAQKLWERYYEGLVRLARANLPAGRRKQGDDEADVAVSAMDSFLKAAQHGRFPKLHSRDNLWALLATITMRKAWKVARRERRNLEVGESALGLKPDDSQGLQVWERVLSREPTPEFAAQMAEQCHRLLDRLGEKKEQNLVSVALWKMEGYTNAEIAAKLGRVVATVERKLQTIRKIWEKEMDL
jgi:DNA-directed RNA polymerase specialized sigma24 family protein